MGLYGGMKMKKKSLVFIMALMCLVIGCAINATIVNAKTNPNVIERKTDDITVGKYEITLYTSCCNVTKGIYYYNTYENHQISAVDMHVENLDSDKMICYPVIQGERINYQNK